VRNTNSGAKREASGSVPTAAHSWAAVSTGRIIGLTILDFLGVHVWDGLPVIAFPVRADLDSRDSNVLVAPATKLRADQDYLADIRRAARPVRVYVGGVDELLDAEKLKNEFSIAAPRCFCFRSPGLRSR